MPLDQAPGRPTAGFTPKPRGVPHISRVFLAGDRAYKLKKPITLDFLDYGTVQRRREMCLEEVRLNSRLAPDIYLGVLAVVPGLDGVVLRPPDDPRAIDFVVVMRRYDERATLAETVRRGETARSEVADLGAALAAFHRGAPSARLTGGGGLRVAVEVEQNLRELLALLTDPEERGRLDIVGRLLRSYACSRSEQLDARASGGSVREVTWRPACRARRPASSPDGRRLRGVRPGATDSRRCRRPGVPGHGPGFARRHAVGRRTAQLVPQRRRRLRRRQSRLVLRRASCVGAGQSRDRPGQSSADERGGRVQRRRGRRAAVAGRAAGVAGYGGRWQ